MITVTISGPQGSGKTELMEIIEEYCKKNKYNYILKEETNKTFTVQSPDIISIDTNRQTEN